MGHPLDDWSDVFRAAVHDHRRVCVGYLTCLPDLSFERFGTCFGNRESDGCWVSSILRMVFGEMGCHAVVVIVASYVLHVLINSCVSAEPGFTPINIAT